MRKVVVPESVTLDGVMEDSGGPEGFEHGGRSIRSGGEEQERFMVDEPAAAHAFLGRMTYPGLAAARPGMTEGYEGHGHAERAEYASMMNSYPNSFTDRQANDSVTSKNGGV